MTRLKKIAMWHLFQVYEKRKHVKKVRDAFTLMLKCVCVFEGKAERGGNVWQ